MPVVPEDHKPKTFTAVTPRGTFQLPFPKAGFLRKNRKLDAVDLMFTCYEEYGSEAFLKALDDMELTEADKLFGDWIGSMGGGDAGKSGGSSN